MASIQTLKIYNSLVYVNMVIMGNSHRRELIGPTALVTNVDEDVIFKEAI